MLYKILSVVFISTWLLLFVIVGSADATDVGGIILEDTTWNLAGSPYCIFETIQIDKDVTLTIEAGVQVLPKNTNDSASIVLYGGNLVAIGTESSKIIFRNIFISAREYSETYIQYARIEEDWVYRGDKGSNFTLLDSMINYLLSGVCRTPWMEIGVSSEKDCHVERNIFISPNRIGISNSSNSIVYFRNNIIFYSRLENQHICGYGIGATGNEKLIVEYNSFLTLDVGYFSLPECGGSLANNYWNTLDTSVIESIIHDRNDYLGCQDYIDYLPVLSEPHPDTPIFLYNNFPTANAGQDQIVFDKITLDGSGSTDTDGTISSLNWVLTHTTNPSFDKTAVGETPVVSNLEKGFYDVFLTVTDDDGAIGTDKMFFAATGTKKAVVVVPLF